MTATSPTGRLFVRDEIAIAAPFDVASDLLHQHLHDLRTHVDRALDHGERIRATLGLGGDSLTISKTVAIEIGHPSELSDRLLVPIRWEATGPSSLFPTMEADLVLRDVPGAGSVLVLRGRYSPPMGTVGDVIDRLLLHRVAQATVHQFVEETAKALVPPD